MHELGIAQAIVDRVAREMERHPGTRARKVGVKIGEISGVDCESLSFGFEALIKDTPYEKLALEIEYFPRRHRCPSCNREFEVKQFESACPKCGEVASKLISGDELDISFIEVDDE